MGSFRWGQLESWPIIKKRGLNRRAEKWVEELNISEIVCWESIDIKLYGETEVRLKIEAAS